MMLMMITVNWQFWNPLGRLGQSGLLMIMMMIITMFMMMITENWQLLESLGQAVSVPPVLKQARRPSKIL